SVPASTAAGPSTTTPATERVAGARCRCAAAALRPSAIIGAERGSAEMSALSAPLILVAARARRRPGHWLLPALGLALATAFACAVAAEGVIAGDRGARLELSRLGALRRSVRGAWQGPLTSQIDRRARALLSGLGLPPPTRVALLNPVRLDSVIVRPAAISPFAAWVGGTSAAAVGACRARVCPMLLAS